MTNNVVFIIKEMNAITGKAPVKKALQKMIYLIEEKGIDLGYEYILHFYGPYCPELDQETRILNSDGIISFDYSHYGHEMSVQECEEIDTSLSTDEKQLVDEIIDRYKSANASELELLATTIYAYEHTKAETRNDIVKNVKKIKGEKYNRPEIEWAINELSYFNIFV